MSSQAARSPRPAGFFQRLAILPREKTDSLLLILSCTLVLLPFSEHSPLWLNTAGALLISWRIWLTISGHAIPPKWLLYTLTATLLASVYAYFQTWFGKDAGISFLLVLACLKMLEMRVRRDAVVVIFTCYFLLVGQLMYSQSLLSALFAAFCICMLISTQFAFQYHHLVPPLSKRLSNGFKIMGLAIPLALILFVFFPRFQGPLWGKPQSNPGGVTGLSDTMEPGNVADLARSDQIAFRVKFQGNAPGSTLLYWRAVILDTYNGTRWTVGRPPATPNEQPLPVTIPTGFPVTQEIIMEPNNQRWLFGLDRPVRVVNSTVLTNTVNGVVSNLTPYWEMRSLYPIQDRIRYTIVSHLGNTTSGATTASEDDRRDAEHRALQLPEGFNPRTLEWVQALRQQTNDPMQLANLVLQYFRDQPFRYTLTPPPLGRDQVDDFLFRTQAGFCEHYSSTFVLIMRALHIPARVVTGYQGGEVNPIDGLMTVRQSDAHAWAEVWIEPRGWIRYDPTGAVSPNRIEHGLNGSFPERNLSSLITFSRQTWISNLTKEIRLRWDATNSAWNLWALNYNLDKQKNLLSGLLGVKHPQAAQIGIAMMVAVFFVAIALSLLLLSKKTLSSPLDKHYNSFCQHMSGLGYPRMPHEGASDYYQRLQLAFTNTLAAKEFLSLFEEYKYGKSSKKTLDPNQLSQLKTLLKLCLQQKLTRLH